MQQIKITFKNGDVRYIANSVIDNGYDSSTEWYFSDNESNPENLTFDNNSKSILEVGTLAGELADAASIDADNEIKKIEFVDVQD